MSITHEDLFALRFALQEIYIDENEIVKRLKLKCINSGMSEEDTNNFLVEFYSIYGITFQLEEIQNINLHTNTVSNSSTNTPFVNSGNLQNIFIPGLNSNVPHSSIPIFSSGQNVFNSALIQYILNPNSNVNNSQLITEINNLENELDDEADSADDLDSIPELEGDDEDNDSLPELEEENYDDMPDLEEIDEVEEVEVNDDIQINQNNVNAFGSIQNNSGIHQPTINISGNRYRMNNLRHTFNSSNLNSVLRNIFLQANNSNMADVVASLAEDDLSNIKTYKFNKDNDDSSLKCTICMDYCKEGEEVCELKCGHKFHKDCIIPYLKDYNYKCPICRKEVGKAKYNT